MNKKINLIINKTGFVFCLLAGIPLFLSEKFENNIVIHALLLAFVISMKYGYARHSGLLTCGFHQRKVLPCVIPRGQCCVTFRICKTAGR